MSTYNTKKSEKKPEYIKKLTKEEKEKKRALKSQTKTMKAITNFFDKVTFGLSTPTEKKKKNWITKKEYPKIGKDY